jgi:hypothetical protein
MTSPAPSRAASRRNGASVTPDIGARKTRFAIVTPPTLSGLTIRDNFDDPIVVAYIVGADFICIEFNHQQRMNASAAVQ